MNHQKNPVGLVVSRGSGGMSRRHPLRLAVDPPSIDWWEDLDLLMFEIRLMSGTAARAHH